MEPSSDANANVDDLLEVADFVESIFYDAAEAMNDEDGLTLQEGLSIAIDNKDTGSLAVENISDVQSELAEAGLDEYDVLTARFRKMGFNVARVLQGQQPEE